MNLRRRVAGLALVGGVVWTGCTPAPTPTPTPATLWQRIEALVQAAGGGDVAGMVLRDDGVRVSVTTRTGVQEWDDSGHGPQKVLDGEQPEPLVKPRPLAEWQTSELVSRLEALQARCHQAGNRARVWAMPLLNGRFTVQEACLQRDGVWDNEVTTRRFVLGAQPPALTNDLSADNLRKFLDYARNFLPSDDISRIWVVKDGTGSTEGHPAYWLFAPAESGGCAMYLRVVVGSPKEDWSLPVCDDNPPPRMGKIADVDATRFMAAVPKVEADQGQPTQMTTIQRGKQGGIAIVVPPGVEYDLDGNRLP